MTLSLVRRLGVLASWVVISTIAPRANAEEPDSALGLFVGATTFVVGFGIGGAVTATATDRDGAQNTAGWFTMQGTFIAAPIVGHAVVHEWGRGLWFAAVPAAALGGSSAVIAVDSQAVRHAQIGEQRLLWGLFSLGLVAGAAGVVDVAFAEERAQRLSITPTVGSGFYGIDVRGAL
jgi:hypothetical protein